MSNIMTPSTEAQLIEAVQWALAQEAPLELVGAGTKRGLGRPVQAAATLDFSGFSGIEAYEPEELILEAGAGSRLAEIEKLLAKHNQQFAFEPPDLSKLLNTKHSGTLGGIMSCNLSGPRRLKAGAARDHVLGVRGITGRGEAFKAGARVVKNVTGYDVPKLMVGAYGTLAALTSITVKVLPRPESEETLILRGLANSRAIEAMSLAMQSSCEVSGAAHFPAALASSTGFDHGATFFRLEGVAPAIAYRGEKLLALLKPFGGVEIIKTGASQKLWRAIRDVHPLCDHENRLIWRVSVAPSEGARVLEAIPQARGFLDWAGGLVWLDVPYADDAQAPAIRRAAGPGHATLISAPKQLRAAVSVFQPQDRSLAALTARVKQSFDPRGVFNPGRMYAGV
jgi:glycolate oxidase FAD binding subunit